MSVVVRDGMEGKGIGTALAKELQKSHDRLLGIPITQGGERLLAKCGFDQQGPHISEWEWRKESNPLESSPSTVSGS